MHNHDDHGGNDDGDGDHSHDDDDAVPEVALEGIAVLGQGEIMPLHFWPNCHICNFFFSMFFLFFSRIAIFVIYMLLNKLHI